MMIRKLAFLALSAVLLLTLPKTGDARNLRNATVMDEGPSPQVRSDRKVTTAEIKFAASIWPLAHQTYNGPPKSGWIGDYKFAGDVTVLNSYVQIYTKGSGMNKDCVVAFRGTVVHDPLDVIHDMHSQFGTIRMNGYDVGAGFAQQYLEVRGLLKLKLASPSFNCAKVISTGHSLGGSVASVAHLDELSSSSVTFAEGKVFLGKCPRKQAANAQRYEARLDGKPDIFPTLPIGLNHCSDLNVQLVEDNDHFYAMDVEESPKFSVDHCLSVDAHFGTVYTRVFAALLEKFK